MSPWIRNLFTASSLAAAPTLAFAQAPAGPASEHAALFKKLDADSNGKLTKEELPEEQRRLFERLIGTQDKDKDGQLSEAEFVAGLSEGRPRGEAPAGGPGGRPGGGGQFNPDEMFSRIDRNGDGKVTLEELPEERREGFKTMLARVDDDKDGAASREEFRRGFGGPGASQPGQPGRPGATGMPMPGGPLLAALDKNRDGELSADEIAQAGDALKKLDRDGDGKLSPRELMPARPDGAGAPSGQQPNAERMLAYFKQMDKNGDGKLSKEEAPERMRENFATIDGNGDGQLDDAELKQMAERFARAGNPQNGRPEMRRPDGQPRPEGRRPEGERKPEADGKPAGERKPEGEARRPEGGRPEGARGEMPPERREAMLKESEERFKAADKDGDGKLSKEEVPERMREHFADIDRNSDGSISLEEMREAGRRMMERRGEGRPDNARRPEERRPERKPEAEDKTPPAKTDVPKKDNAPSK